MHSYTYTRCILSTRDGYIKEQESSHDLCMYPFCHICRVYQMNSLDISINNRVPFDRRASLGGMFESALPHLF